MDELFHFKMSWAELDKHLQKENIIDERQVAELIAKYQAGAIKGIDRLTKLQKISVFVGIGFVLALILIFMIDTSFFKEWSMAPKFMLMAGFVIITIVLGFCWDVRTYRFSRNTKVAEMPIVEVIARMNKFARWMKYEVAIVSVWILTFFSLYYWVMELYNLPLHSQLIFVIVSLAIVGVLMYVMYRKLIYKNINQVKKNLIEIKELESDSIA